MEIRPNDPDYPGKLADPQLENEVDHAAKVYLRNDLGNEERLPEYDHVGKGPKNYQRSDERIQDDVCEALHLSYDVDASDIEVEVKEGCVYLRGNSDNRETKWAAEDTVEGIPGVKDVMNELKVKSKEPKIGRRTSSPDNEAETRLV